MERTIRTADLEIAYREHGDAAGSPVILLHGFPDDAHAYDGVAERLAAAGYCAIAPYLRGFGPTRFLDAGAPRAGQQAAIGTDLIQLIGALRLERVALVGHDWGGRAACIAAALVPERIRCLVAIQGYSIQNTSRPFVPAAVLQERRYWYQWYFCTERGRLGLKQNRQALCRLLWEEWSPTWRFEEAWFQQTAASFDNPDFVPVVIHSYRHRNGQAEGYARYATMEEQLAVRPPIRVPTLVLHGADDRVGPPELSEGQENLFMAGYERRILPGIGHFPAAEAPDLVAAEILRLLSASS